MVKIILVDDHLLVRKGTRILLEKVPGFKVVAEFHSGEEALRWCRVESTDVVVIDIELTGMSGLETIARLKRIAPEIPIVALTMHVQSSIVKKVLQAGVAGFVGKNCTADELVIAIKSAVQGGHYIPSVLAQSLVWMEGKEERSSQALLELSEREQQIFHRLIRGDTPQKVARDYALSPKTVHTYRHRLFKKLAIKNDIELMQFAVKHGLVEKDSLILNPSV